MQKGFWILLYRVGVSYSHFKDTSPCSLAPSLGTRLPLHTAKVGVERLYPHSQGFPQSYLHYCQTGLYIANTILPKLDSNPCVAVPCRYSVAYFDRIAVFKAPYRWTSVKGEGSCALHRLVSYSCIYEAHMSPTLKGSSAIQRFERSDAIKIRDGITFNFYTGLPHVQNPTYGTNCMNHANLGRAWMRWLRYTATSTPFNNTKACNQQYLDR